MAQLAFLFFTMLKAVENDRCSPKKQAVKLMWRD